jgi:hypothetical protein
MMDLETEEPPVWFWNLLDEARPSLDRLASILENLSAEQLEAFQRFYSDAALAVCPYWEGPYSKRQKQHLSEDGTQDFCEWVVSQGLTLWKAAVSDKTDLSTLADVYLQAEYEGRPEYPKWRAVEKQDEYFGWLGPACLAFAVYERRFGGNLYEILNP